MKSPPDKLGLTVLTRNNFDGLEYLHILQGKNEIIDELAKLGSSQAMIPLGIFL
jgi:hypothetical protein